VRKEYKSATQRKLNSITVVGLKKRKNMFSEFYHNWSTEMRIYIAAFLSWTTSGNFYNEGEGDRFSSLHYDRGMDYYAEYFEDAGNAKAIGEGTPSYSLLPFAADRIKKHFPENEIDPLLSQPDGQNFFELVNAERNGQGKINRFVKRLKLTASK
jgi:hypothetical protein